MVDWPRLPPRERALWAGLVGWIGWTGFAVKFPPEGLAGGGEQVANDPAVGPGQVQTGLDALGRQPFGPSAGDPGDLGDRPLGQ